MAIIPSSFRLDWSDPSQPGGVMSTLNNNANTATSFATQYTMQDIIDTVAAGGGGPYVPYLSGADQIARTEDFNFPSAVYGNTSLGFQALQSLNSSDAQYNVAIGYLAGTNITNGEKNVVIGGKAGDGMTTAEYNVVIGYDAGGFNTFTGFDNVLIGRSAGFAHENASDNVAIGDNALNSATDARKNTAVGSAALASSNAAGDGDNVGVGYRAGYTLTTGIENTLLGTEAVTLNNSDNNSIVIGNDITGGGTDTMTIGNTNNTTLILPGLQAGASDGDVLTYSSGSGDITLQTPGGGIPWPYQYDAGNGQMLQGENPATTQVGVTCFGVGAGANLGPTGGGVPGDSGNTAFGYNALNLENNEVQCTAIGYKALANFTSVLLLAYC